eukprot:4820672-Amphidinium_carterae.1
MGYITPEITGKLPGYLSPSTAPATTRYAFAHVPEVSSMPLSSQHAQCVQDAHNTWTLSRYTHGTQKRAHYTWNMDRYTHSAQQFATYTWTMSRATRNRLQHAYNGNGRGGKGKGKDKQQHISEADAEREYRDSVRQAQPLQAQIRSQTTLVQSEWQVPFQPWQHLSNHAGVAVVPREAVPRVLQQIGFRAQPVGAVLVQSPEELHLRGYPRQRIHCTLDVSTPACTTGLWRPGAHVLLGRSHHCGAPNGYVQCKVARKVRMGTGATSSSAAGDTPHTHHWGR